MKIQIHRIYKCRIAPGNKTLSPYMSFTESEGFFWKITFIYIMQGEAVEHSFRVLKFIPTFIGQYIAARNRSRFERRVLQCLRWQEWHH